MSFPAVSRRALARRILLVSTIVAFVGVVPIDAAHSLRVTIDSPVSGGLGLAPLTGLLPGLPGTACAGLFEIVGASPTRCTHGPDQQPPATQTAEAGSASNSSGGLVGTSSRPFCYGDGQDGARVELIYASTPGTSDRFTSVLGSIWNLMANVDNVMSASAAKTAGTRHFRFVTDRDCAPVVHDVQLASDAEQSFAATINDLIALGFNRTDRHYLVLVDSNFYCGIATVNGDDQPYVDNASNRGPGYARIDRHCWNTGSAAHELMHMLGAVQLSAPHSTGHYHCTDTPDAMCYADASDVHTTQRCSSNAARLYDCNDDDYFNTDPLPDSYLGTHWNTADNAFLETRPGADTYPGPPIAPPVGRHKTVVLEFSGSLGPMNHMEIIPLDVYDGMVSLHFEYDGIGSMSTRLEDPSGLALASWSGPSPQDHSRPSSSGSYRLVINGDGPANFRGTVSYVAP